MVWLAYTKFPVIVHKSLGGKKKLTKKYIGKKINTGKLFSAIPCNVIIACIAFFCLFLINDAKEEKCAKRRGVETLLSSDLVHTQKLLFFIGPSYPTVVLHVELQVVGDLPPREGAQTRPLTLFCQETHI